MFSSDYNSLRFVITDSKKLFLKSTHLNVVSICFLSDLLEHLKTNHVGNVRVKNQMKLSTEAMVAMPVTLQTGKGHPDYPSSVCCVHECLVYLEITLSCCGLYL